MEKKRTSREQVRVGNTSAEQARANALAGRLVCGAEDANQPLHEDAWRACEEEHQMYLSDWLRANASRLKARRRKPVK